MNHPPREEWMSYLHDELNGPAGRALQQHLGDCAECRAQVTAWQETRRQLDTWKLAPPSPRRSFQFGWARMAGAAAAAVVLLAAGLAVGRGTAPSRTEFATLQAQFDSLKTSMDARVESAARAQSQSVLREFATSLESRLQDLQAEHGADYATLRRELETVAILTQAGFNQTANRFDMLANSSSPETTH